jgi:hypothetical protein
MAILRASLIGDELPSRRHCSVVVCLNEVDPENEAVWPRQQEWLAKACKSCTAVSRQGSAPCRNRQAPSAAGLRYSLSTHAWVGS